MYLRVNDRSQQAGLQGFSEATPANEHQKNLDPILNDLARSALGRVRDTSEHGKSLDAILKALQLNPVGGYVKGSLARKRLEEAFESVPVTSALELYNQLGKGEGSLGRLFQYRLHDATKASMLKILWRKHLEQQQIRQKAEQELKQVCEEARKRIETLRAVVTEFQSVTESICRSHGEDSDLCEEFRFRLLEATTKLDDSVRWLNLSCP